MSDVSDNAAKLPTQTEMNQRFYVDVCRAEDRIKQLAHLGRALLDTLPPHWHDDATVEFRNAIEEIEKGQLVRKEGWTAP